MPLPQIDGSTANAIKSIGSAFNPQALAQAQQLRDAHAQSLLQQQNTGLDIAQKQGEMADESAFDTFARRSDAFITDANGMVVPNPALAKQWIVNAVKTRHAASIPHAIALVNQGSQAALEFKQKIQLQSAKPQTEAQIKGGIMQRIDQNNPDAAEASVLGIPPSVTNPETGRQMIRPGVESYWNPKVGNTPQQPGVGSEIGRITTYRQHGDETPDSLTSAGLSAIGKIRPDSMAVSPDVEAGLRAKGIKIGSPVTLRMDDGSTVNRFWDDRTAKAYHGKQLTGRVDLLTQDGAVNPLQDHRVVDILSAAMNGGDVSGGLSKFSPEDQAGVQQKAGAIQSELSRSPHIAQIFSTLAQAVSGAPHAFGFTDNRYNELGFVPRAQAVGSAPLGSGMPTTEVPSEILFKDSIQPQADQFADAGALNVRRSSGGLMELGGPKAPVGEGGRRLSPESAKIQDGIISTTDSLNSLQELIGTDGKPGLLASNQKAFGPHNYLPSILADNLKIKGYNDGVTVRGKVMDLSSRIIKERTGTAQSKQELDNLRSFVIRETDTADVVSKKINNLAQYLREHLMTLKKQGSKESGYIMNPEIGDLIDKRLQGASQLGVPQQSAQSGTAQTFQTEIDARKAGHVTGETIMVINPKTGQPGRYLLK